MYAKAINICGYINIIVYKCWLPVETEVFVWLLLIERGGEGGDHSWEKRGGWQSLMREGIGDGEKLISDGSRISYSESDQGGDATTLPKQSLAFG